MTTRHWWTYQDVSGDYFPFPLPVFLCDPSGSIDNVLASLPVALTAAQLATLTPLSVISLSAGNIATLTPLSSVDLNAATIAALTPTALTGVLSANITAGQAGPIVIKATSGVFFGICVNSVGVGVPQAFDNTSAASGKILGTLVASAPVGIASIVPAQGARFANGLTFSGGALNPAMTVYYL